jgi:4-hydroxybenzoate polyprenyltransferase
MGAWMFVLGGLVGFILALIGHPILAFSIFGVAAITPVFYSLWLYKRLERQGRLGEP